MYRIVPPFPGPVCHLLAFAALLHSGMAHSHKVPAVASNGADGVMDVQG